MSIEIINNSRRPASGGGKANAKSGGNICPHTVKAEDLRIHRKIVGEGGLSMVLRLK